MASKFSKRGKAILVGLFLSKFDNVGLSILGFEGFNQAYNAFGYSIGVEPASIKNYRDEFDPYFPNSRKGWHKRDLRDYCKQYLDDYSDLDLNTFTELITNFVINDQDLENIADKVEEKYKSESVAKRLVTGKAAEEYFKLTYSSINEFADFKLKDTTKLGCGFDFKLSLDSNIFCVEVKGLDTRSGIITMTEKEFYVAGELKDKYCLFVVTNFIEKPMHQFLIDPLNSRLSFDKIEREVTQINYSTSI